MNSRAIIEAAAKQPFPGSKLPQMVWHGTGEQFNRFSLSKAAMPIIWFSSDRRAVEAGEKANRKEVILGLYVDLKKPAGWEEYQKMGLWELKRGGYDGAILVDPDGSFDGFVFHPNQIRIAERHAGKTAAQGVVEAVSNHTQLAKQIISVLYGKGSLSPSDKYRSEEIRLMAQNDEQTVSMLPQDEDEEEAVMNEIVRLVDQREDRVFKKRATKFKQLAGDSSEDPLAHLRVIARGKTWDEFKRAALKTMPGDPTPSDDLADVLMGTQFNANRGATFANTAKFLDTHPNSWRLSDGKVYPRTEDNKREQSEMVRYYFGGQVPETVTVYRGVPRPDVKIKPGDYCTLDRSVARGYALGPHAVILTQKLPAKDLIVDKPNVGNTELIYWPKGSEVPERGKPHITARELWAQENPKVGSTAPH